ncbi:MAG: YjjG family noncanonical pyrimidine nucleotidase [Clostridiales bacterium]
MTVNKANCLYDDVLFDADDTLFDFRQAEKEAFFAVFQQRGFTMEAADLQDYIRINESLWRELELGLIEKADLKVLRFTRFFEELSQSPDKAKADTGKALLASDVWVFAEDYLTFLGQGSHLMPEALAVCQTLSRICRLSIITNGISRVQESRLAASAIKPYISGLFVSEAFGAAKPQPEFFNPVFRILGIDSPVKKKRTIICGDSLTSDMAGGIRAGIDTCWYAPSGDFAAAQGLPITYRIRRLQEIIAIVRGEEYGR